MKAVNGLKKCSKYGEVKGVDEFGKNKNILDGLNNYCKNCWIVINMIYRENNREKVRASSKKWKDSNQEKLMDYLNKTKEDRYNYGKDYVSKNRSRYNLNSRLRRAADSEKFRLAEKRCRTSKCENMSDSYIVRTMIRYISDRDIIYSNPILIDVKRELIKTKRLLGQTSFSYQCK